MSLVLMSPSTVMTLNDLSIEEISIFRSMGAATAASVTIKQSIVAMSGWIMPEPLAMPAIVTVFPPISSCTAVIFG
jgi:hypothetical protein